MTTFASPLAKAQAKLAAARNAARSARITRDQTIADRRVAESAYTHWSTQWPNIDRLPDRPTYEGPGGLAVKADGSPFMVEDGMQANQPDLYCSPPPSDKTLAALEAQVSAAIGRLDG